MSLSHLQASMIVSADHGADGSVQESRGCYVVVELLLHNSVAG